MLLLINEDLWCPEETCWHRKGRNIAEVQGIPRHKIIFPFLGAKRIWIESGLGSFVKGNGVVSAIEKKPLTIVSQK